jgi:hypothetical protein
MIKLTQLLGGLQLLLLVGAILCIYKGDEYGGNINNPNAIQALGFALFVLDLACILTSSIVLFFK